eukprot:6464855-Amphidinium_carterae.1
METVMKRHFPATGQTSYFGSLTGTNVYVRDSHISGCGADGLWLDAPDRVVLEKSNIWHNACNGILAVKSRSSSGCDPEMAHTHTS